MPARLTSVFFRERIFGIILRFSNNYFKISTLFQNPCDFLLGVQNLRREKFSEEASDDLPLFVLFIYGVKL